MAEQDIRVFFSGLEDPRVDRTKRHVLADVIVIAVLAVVCGADDWDDVSLFARIREAWLTELLGLRHGVPSTSTFKRVFRALDPVAFANAFASWTRALVGTNLEGKLVAIDGKTLRGSFKEPSKKGAIHLVTAWVVENKVVFGQLGTDAKSNEITVIPELLKMLALKGATVTIDAMGCQRNIAAQIVESGGDYVLALKGNQPTLAEEVEAAFVTAEIAEEPLKHEQRYEETEKAHGRIQRRCVIALDVADRLTRTHQWKGLRSIIMVDSTRTVDGEQSQELRYYISSHKPDAQMLARCIRQHWSIENNQHWELDVTFREDRSRIRDGSGPDNFAALRRMALSMVTKETSRKSSKKCKRKAAGWDAEYLLKILKANLPESDKMVPM